ncbi:MAG: LptF/LptG family permease, partial [Muribaculaceae bacterium]|nr:LptF/LptG family permease [Muribaculaceae bacterium]
FFYAAVSMVPMALPLAVLLASLMTFGNFGEKFELTAMKASGISLLQSMKPLIVLIAFVAIGAFYFQNNVLPKAQVKMWTLLFSAKQKSPELEIPEGVFYDQIPGYNLFVREKDRNTGMLRDVMIYANANGSANTTILLADSAQMATTKDFRYLYLHLYEGEQFENLREQTTSDANVPFRRESFADKQVLISFDANFNRLDEGGMRSQYIGKNMSELRHSIDSIGNRVDSMGNMYGRDLKLEAFPLLETASANGYRYGSRGSITGTPYYAGTLSEPTTAPSPYSGVTPESSEASSSAPSFGEGDEIASSRESYSETSSVEERSIKKDEKERSKPEKREIKTRPIDVDSLLTALSPSERSEVFNSAAALAKRHQGEVQFRAEEMASEEKVIRRHQIELIKKFTLSVACLIFFFIGAPLGAIIRKGGLGTPLVISVLLFLVYYIIDNTGYKMARDGHIEVWIGMWLSTFILAPLSIYVTYKAMNDSSVFDKDRYVALMRKIFGIRTPRTVAFKEVIINEVDETYALRRLELLKSRCRRLIVDIRIISYREYWEHGISRQAVAKLGKSLESTISYLSDSRDPKLIDMLSNYPEFRARRLYHPVNNKRLSRLMMWFVPVGYPVYLMGRYAMKGLKKDLRKTMKTTREVERMLK